MLLWKMFGIPKILDGDSLLGYLVSTLQMASWPWKYFTNKNLKHHTFKMAAAQAMTNYLTINLCKTRQLEKSSITEDALHTMAKLPNFRNCYYCWHGYSTPRTNRKSTTFKCIQCNVPSCKPSKGQCWELHLNGLPKPKYKKPQKHKKK